VELFPIKAEARIRDHESRVKIDLYDVCEFDVVFVNGSVRLEVEGFSGCQHQISWENLQAYHDTIKQVLREYPS
jgi:hypothetical protein